MKKSLILFFVLIIAALSVLSVSAAPRDRYYDQMGNKYWCNSDSYGCWVTGENGEHEYIMFWSESARDAIMGPDSNAPLGTNPGTSELPLLPPVSVSAASGGKGDYTDKCKDWNDAACAEFFCDKSCSQSEKAACGEQDCNVICAKDVSTPDCCSRSTSCG